MKLFKIQRIGQTDWDEYDRFVVRAIEETDARLICHLESGEKDTWTNPEKSTCIALDHDGKAEVVCASFNAG